MDKKNIILYGGAFNPPTLAHLQIIQACVDYARAHSAEVWIMPSGTRPDKTITVSRTRRLAYIDALLADVESDGVDVRVVTLELDRQVPVETIDTIKELNDVYPDHHFMWVFGADSTETMPEWRGGDYILNELDKLVVTREGSVVNPEAHRVTMLLVRTTAVSSTEVRARMTKGLSLAGLVTPAVARLCSAG